MKKHRLILKSLLIGIVCLSWNRNIGAEDTIDREVLADFPKKLIFYDFRKTNLLQLILECNALSLPILHPKDASSVIGGNNLKFSVFFGN
jgi:hypothetical protein